jgi:hypothetical protein
MGESPHQVEIGISAEETSLGKKSILGINAWIEVVGEIADTCYGDIGGVDHIVP